MPIPGRAASAWVAITRTIMAMNQRMSPPEVAVLTPLIPIRIPPRAQSTSRQVSPITFSGRLIAPCMVGFAQPRVSP